jgi:CHAD domain-containing protein
VLAGRLCAQADALEENAGRVMEKDDPDAVHDLRVASRRLRAALQLAGEIAGRKKARRLRRELGRLGRALGDLREADVNAALLREGSFPESPARETAREALLAAVITEARRLRRRVVKRLKKTDAPSLAGDIRSYADSLRESKEVASLAGFARVHIEQARRPVLVARERSVRRPTAQNLHQLRIAAKKFRYAVELLSPAFEPRRGGRIRRRLKSLQDLLGRYHDFVVLASEIRRRRSRLRADGLALLDRETGAVQRRVAAEEASARQVLVRKVAREDMARFLESIPQALKPEPSAETPRP